MLLKKARYAAKSGSIYRFAIRKDLSRKLVCYANISNEENASYIELSEDNISNRAQRDISTKEGY